MHDLVFFLDVKSPNITCPANQTSDTEKVEWVHPNATDNADPAPIVTCTPSSGSSFSAGITEVTCVAVDQAGNKDQCTFTVKAGTLDRF